MYCPHCGAEIPDGSKFCTFCGKAVQSPQPVKDVWAGGNTAQTSVQPNYIVNPVTLEERKRREAKQALQILGIIDIVNFVFTGFSLFIILSVFYMMVSQGGDVRVTMGVLIYVLESLMTQTQSNEGTIAVFVFIILLVLLMFWWIGSLLAGIGLLKHKKWAMILHLIVWIPQITNIPIGTIVAVYSIMMYQKPEVKELLEEENELNVIMP